MSTSLWTICETQYFPRNLHIQSEKTKYAYRQALRRFSACLSHEATLDDLDDDIVTMWVGAERRQVKSAETVNHRLDKVLALWRWCAKRRLVERFPTVNPLRAPDPLPRAWTRDELRRLFAAADLEGGLIGPVPARLWWRARLAFHWYTGERKGAVDALRQEWCQLDAGWCAIPAEARKGGLKPAVYHLPPPLAQSLRDIWQPVRDLVFPWEKCDGMYFKTWNRILKAADLPTGRNSKTKSLRVSHASHLHQLGRDATQSLMHSDPATTIRHYLDRTLTRQQDTPLFVPWAG